MKLALGTAQFGMPYGIVNKSGRVAQEEVKAILQVARLNGIDTLDTAIGYGESENALGTAGVRAFKVVTKLSAVPDQCADVANWITDQVDNSLRRLGLNAVYGLLLHRPTQLTEAGGRDLYDALIAMKNAGKTLKIGISIYQPAELDVLINQQGFHFDMVQAPINVFDRRMISSGWLRRLKDAGVEVHARSAFLQGLLLTPLELIPEKFANWNTLWREWHEWLARNNIGALEACLQFLQNHTEIDRVIVGVDSLEQLSQIIGASTCGNVSGIPSVFTNDDNLINPSRWALL